MNPHAGEAGILGEEEAGTIIPALNMRKRMAFMRKDRSHLKLFFVLLQEKKMGCNFGDVP